MGSFDDLCLFCNEDCSTDVAGTCLMFMLWAAEGILHIRYIFCVIVSKEHSVFEIPALIEQCYRNYSDSEKLVD